VNARMFRDAKAGGYTAVPADFHAFCCRMFSHFASTGVTENSFHYCKAQNRANQNDKFSSLSMWHNETAAKVLPNIYNFREVTCDAVPDPAVKKNSSFLLISLHLRTRA
jgi:hypothetical protein